MKRPPESLFAPDGSGTASPPAGCGEKRQNVREMPAGCWEKRRNVREQPNLGRNNEDGIGYDEEVADPGTARRVGRKRGFPAGKCPQGTGKRGVPCGLFAIFAGDEVQNVHSD